MPRKNINVWEVYSYAKANTCDNCPFEFKLLYTIPDLRRLLPVHIATAFGIVIHYWLDMFFKKRYRSKGTYIGSFIRYMTAVLSGVHGPGAMNEKPVPIFFDGTDPEMYIPWGIKILSQFYDENIAIREAANRPISEFKFNDINLGGIKLNGKIDRIVLPWEGGYEIVDYKRSLMSATRRLKSYQMTVYQYSATKRIGYPPNRMSVWSYGNGWQKQEVPLRDEQAFRELFEWLLGTAVYIKAVLTQRMPPREFQPFISRFNLEDIERGDFSPKLPRGPHCVYCGGQEICRMKFGGLAPNGNVTSSLVKSQLWGLSNQQLELALELVS
jgi:hypothetical protein